jgi:hypothetical protein
VASGAQVGPGGALAAAATSTRALPELGSVYWRPRVTEGSLRRRGQLWTLTTIVHTIPFIVAGVLLALAKPVTLPVDFVLLAHAWAIPELYAARGAGVLRRAASVAPGDSEQRAVGLLGDLIDHSARALLGRTGLVIERGELGVWLLGDAGAVLVRPGGRRIVCYCVRATDPELPYGDRVAHLLLALREDESGFATVANLAFSGAPWRLRRRLPVAAREGLAEAVSVART